MFCPKCSQPQPAEDLRFCPRCGFQLEGVALLVANGGVWPAPVEPTPAQALTPRRRGMRQGGKLMLAGAALTPILGILAGVTWGAGEVALLGVIIFIAGLARLLYAAIFQDSHPDAQPGALPPSRQPAVPLFQPAQPRASLPQHQASAPESFRRRDKAELVAPPASVTENTTRLLDEQADTSNR